MHTENLLFDIVEDTSTEQESASSCRNQHLSVSKNPPTQRKKSTLMKYLARIAANADDALRASNRLEKADHIALKYTSYSA
ncbi:MAG: hypothetical protein AB7D27_03145 [Desulfomicrobium sp.]